MSQAETFTLGQGQELVVEHGYGWLREGKGFRPAGSFTEADLVMLRRLYAPNEPRVSDHMGVSREVPGDARA